VGKILCATRGGEESQRTQEAAIELAKAAGDKLVFLFIFDMEFMKHANYAMRSEVVEEELEQMARFLMTMAVERAEQQGIPARFLIREGSFATELAAAAIEEKATLVVLGYPGEEGNKFALSHLRELADRLQADTGIPFRILPSMGTEEQSGQAD